MPGSAPEKSTRSKPTVFLSYASEDRRAAQLIRDALPDFALEVCYDESDLVGGDAWDQKIRGGSRRVYPTGRSRRSAAGWCPPARCTASSH